MASVYVNYNFDICKKKSNSTKAININNEMVNKN